MSLTSYDKLRDLQSRTMRMVRDFLMEEVYHDVEPQDLAKEWGTTYQHVRNLTNAEPIIAQDLLQMLDYTSLDFGIVIRDPATGKEVTFFAADNLASHLEHSSQTEEVQYYGSDKKGDDPLSDEDSGLDFLPREHTVLYDANGKEIREKSLREQLETPIEIDGNFDVDKELGEDIIEAEFEELTQRDLEDFETKCENCLDEERLPDSMLCFHCTALGIECNPPEDPERPEDYEPLELLAVIDQRAQRTKEHSERLLRNAGMLTNTERIRESIALKGKE